jgi:hypothetical protein
MPLADPVFADIAAHHAEHVATRRRWREQRSRQWGRSFAEDAERLQGTVVRP